MACTCVTDRCRSQGKRAAATRCNYEPILCPKTLNLGTCKEREGEREREREGERERERTERGGRGERGIE